MAEEESIHRRECEKKSLEADIQIDVKDDRARTRGQWLAFSIVVVIGGAGVYLAMNGHEWAGSVFGGPAIASIIAHFLIKKDKAKD